MSWPPLAPFQRVGLCIPIRTCISFKPPANGQKSRPCLHSPKKVGRQAQKGKKKKEIRGWMQSHAYIEEKRGMHSVATVASQQLRFSHPFPRPICFSFPEKGNLIRAR